MIEAEKIGVDQSKTETEDKVVALCEDLAAAVVCDISEETVDAAEKELALIGLRPLRDAWIERKVEKEKRLAEIGQNQLFIDAELLIDDANGEYKSKWREAKEKLNSVETCLLQFNSDRDFLSLYRVKDKPAPEGFVKKWQDFWGITDRWQKKTAMTLQRYHVLEAAEMFEAYEQDMSLHNALNAEAQTYEQKISLVEALVREHEKLGIELDTFENELLEALRKKAKEELYACENLSELRRTVRDEARVVVSTIVALKEKVKYFSQMSDYLLKEIVDRQTRINGIDTVRNKWRYSSRWYLSGDKENWLVNVPNARYASTRKMCSNFSGMHQGINAYDNYTAFDRGLNVLQGVLIYDLFFDRDHMPYDGFAQAILPDVADYRAENGAADFAIIQEAIEGENSVDSQDALATMAEDESGGGGSVDFQYEPDDSFADVS